MRRRRRRIGRPYRSINFARPPTQPGLLVLAAAVGVMLLCLLVGVISMQLRLRSASRTLDALNAERAAAAEILAGAPALTIEYERRTGAGTKELNDIDRQEVLALLERDVLPAAQVRSFRVSGNEVWLQLCGVTLEQAGDLIDVLQAEETVSRASISQAGGENGMTDVTILFRGKEEEP